MRRILRRTLRALLRIFPIPVVLDQFARIPYSRLAGIGNRLFSGSEIITHHGIQIHVNPGDNLGFYAYFLGGQRDHEVEMLIDLCAQARVFVDIGANAGWYSLAIARACANLAVVAFEPERKIAIEFRENLERNKELQTRVTLVERAVGDRNDELFFQPSASEKNPGVGRVTGEARSADAYKVPVVRLDSFCESGLKPDVVKIDVEGAEVDVLRGLSGLYKFGFPGAVLVETHAFYFPASATEFNAQVMDELKLGGFSILRLQSGEWLPQSTPLGDIPRTHLLAVRDGSVFFDLIRARG
jgi:FkbM family methyltransferase